MQGRQPQKILLTGANGRLGHILRPNILKHYSALKSTDLHQPDRLLEGETFAKCDLSNFVEVQGVVTEVNAIVHFGGISNEAPFEDILDANIRGTHHLLEAARQNGVRRVVMASSNHVVGFYPVEEKLDRAAPFRPDTFYGVSKAFTETLGRLYADKYGLEVACLRIGSCVAKPTSAKHLATWLSHADLTRLVFACLDAPKLKYEMLYGISDNDAAWWTNAGSSISYTPMDRASDYADRVASLSKEERFFQGGRGCYKTPEDSSKT